jgi:arylamine N-acetyltransferase
MRPVPHPPLPDDPEFPTSFFARLDLADAKPEPSLTFLNRLIAHSVTRIPFETLQLHEPVAEAPYERVPSQSTTFSTPIDASIAAIWKKIASGRGGYCFELNHCLFAALRASGIRDIVQHGSQVPYERNESRTEESDPWIFATAAHICKPGSIGPLTHRVSILGLSKEGGQPGFDQYLLDIGYGSGAPALPVPLDGRVVGSKYGRWRAVQGLWGEPYPSEEIQTKKDWLSGGGESNERFLYVYS